MQYTLAYLTVFGVALGASLVATPLAKGLARRVGVLDQPSQRKVHLSPTPLMGGLAIYAGFWASVLAISRFQVAAPEVFLPDTTRELAAIFVATLTLMVVGVVDDKLRGGLPPGTKLAAQLVAAGVAIVGGLQLRVFGVPWLDLALTVLWIVGLSNAINLLDNMDGLSAGATAIAAVFFFAIAALNGQVLVGAMALALAGACAGFLRYNFNPATVFMGDTGTLFLGFLLAVIGLKLKASGPAWWSFILVVVVLALPIFDTGLVTAYRLRKRLALAQGGKDHTSHRLVKLGLPQPRAVLVLYGAAVCAGMVALALARGGSTWGPCWPCRPWRWSSAPATSLPGSRSKAQVARPSVRGPKSGIVGSRGFAATPAVLLALLVGYLVLRGALGALLNPPFNGPDEGGHWEYLESWTASGGQAVTGVERLAAPLYYALAALPFRLTEGAPVGERLFTVRLLSVAAGVVTAGATWLSARWLWPRRPLLALLAAGWRSWPRGTSSSWPA